MTILNNDPVPINAFIDADEFVNFQKRFQKRQQEYAYIAYEGPYIKWSRDDDIDAYVLVSLLQYLHDLGCPKITLAVFEPHGTDIKLPLGMSIGYPASTRGHNWIQKGFSITDDATICDKYTVYKYTLEGNYDSLR
jgi:hypothetical protein